MSTYSKIYKYNYHAGVSLRQLGLSSLTCPFIFFLQSFITSLFPYSQPKIDLHRVLFIQSKHQAFIFLSMEALTAIVACNPRCLCAFSQLPKSSKAGFIPLSSSVSHLGSVGKSLSRGQHVDSSCIWHRQRVRVQYTPGSRLQDSNTVTEGTGFRKDDLLVEKAEGALRDGVQAPAKEAISSGVQALAKEAISSLVDSQQGMQETHEKEEHSLPNREIVAGDDMAGGSRRTKLSHNIIFVAAEVAPYSKTGGLGDVCGSLPIALASRGHRVMVISPRYMNGVTDERYKGAFDVQCRIKIICFGGEHQVAFFHEYRAGVDWVFVDHPSYHRPGNPYGDNLGAFGDNQFRFTLLCHAACEAPLVLPLGGFTYGEKCIFIANDWHASLVPVLIAAQYRPHGVYRDARSILSIHNLAHQGVEPGTTYGNLGLPPDWYGSLEWVFPTWARKHALDRGEAVNHLKGAIVTSDRILTVSEGYAWEITTKEGGWGLDELLQSRKTVINGITNGIDVDDWNPASDKYIPFHYSAEDLSGKAECKAALQLELGLTVRPDVPLIGFIGRLDYQKGLDLIQSALPELMQEDVQLVMLGSGDPTIESWMKISESTYKDRFRGWVGFSVPVSHKITAGCDILLMPSRFEPCGLNQLYAMRYGTVPIVHCTGGLRDTVEDFDPFANEGEGVGTGWRFSPLSTEAMLGTLKIAMDTYRRYKSSWEGIMKRGMLQNFTWDNAASHYEQVFEWAKIDSPYAP